MNLYLRKVVRPQAHDNYRVILKLAWRNHIVIPMRTLEAQGEGKDRRDFMNQFKVA